MSTQKKTYQALIEMCQIAEIKCNARDAHANLGFICAIAAAPEALELQEWFPLLWQADKAFTFSNAAIANRFAAATLAFYDACLLNYQSSKSLHLPSDLWLAGSQQVTEQGRAFASGYLRAFEYTESLWLSLNLATGSEPEQLLQTTMLLLSKMATVESHTTQPTQLQALFSQLPDMQEIVTSLPLLLTAVGHFSTSEALNG